jgi:hypothetical protein
MIAGMREARNTYKIVVGIPDEREHVGDLGVDGTIIFRIRGYVINW